MCETKYPDINLYCEINENYHMGHILLESFKKKQLKDIAQINGITGEEENYHSMHHRVVRLARSLLNLGLKPGDVIALSGVNHLDLRIPFFAGLVNGHAVAGVDPIYKFGEIKQALDICKPKIAFCDINNEENYRRAASELNLDMKVVTFLDGDNVMQKFIEKYDDGESVKLFIPPAFDVDKTYSWLLSTSGSTGVPKFVAVTHRKMQAILQNMMRLFSSNSKLLLLSPVQWISYYVIGIASVFNNNAILLTTDGSVGVVIDIINKYRPNFIPSNPSIFYHILSSEKPCDLTCIDHIFCGGTKLYADAVDELKKRVRPDTKIFDNYGLTESVGVICVGTSETPPGSCGKAAPGIQIKLMDENCCEITKPNVPGELYYKGLMFDGYYNNPEETAKVITEDGWLKTGDQLYRDENGFLYFVERIKSMFKYRGIHIIPIEIESVIRELKAVKDVAVTSISHPTDLAWPAAVVVKKPGFEVTAQEIKDLVAGRLSNAKQLRGGVVFVDKLPETSTGKLARVEVRRIAETSTRE